MKKNKGKKKLGLTTVIFIALIAGAVTGTIINNFFMHIDVVNKVIVAGIFYVIGQGFISLMKIITQSVLDRILSWCLISSAKVFISEKVDNTQILVKFLNGCFGVFVIVESWDI